MANIELLSRHATIDQVISADVSAGVYMFPAWLPIQLFECLMATVLRGPGVNALTAFRVDVADDVAGAANLTLGPTLTTPGTIANLQQWARIECRASDLYGKSATARYCNIHLNAAGAVPFVATLIRYNPDYAHPNLDAGNPPDETAWT